MNTGHADDRADHASTPYALITGIAANASTRRLVALSVFTLIAAPAVLTLSPDFWPLAALSCSTGTIALWGLAAHRKERDPSRLLTILQAILVVVGYSLALTAALGLLFAILGPRWVL
jgi:hypothetical protein